MPVSPEGNSPEREGSPGGSLFEDPKTGSPKRGMIGAVCVALALLLTLWLGSTPELTPAGRRALFVLTLAVLLWVTEVIPAFAVGILIIGLQILLLGRPEGVFAQTERDWEEFVSVIGHPLIWLFFGGFVLAEGMQRCGLDRWLAGRLLTPFGQRPTNVVLGVMSITFVLSMFMSNTATTAMMLAILMPLIATLDERDRLGTGLLVATAVAANLGGMGSLIGTPPNAIAVGALADLDPGLDVSFLEWLLLGFPPAAIVLLIAWRLICWIYPAQAESIRLDFSNDGQANAVSSPGQRLTVAVTMLTTMGLWLTSQWHGIPTAAVSFVPIVVLTTTGVLGVNEIRGLNYDVLFLMAGGLALGQMVTETGLSAWIVAQLPLSGLGPLVLGLLMAYLTVAMSNFMSNTAAANILIPLGITMAHGFEAQVAIPIAFGASAAMCLPVATPPNAMVSATGRCSTVDFLRIGLIIGLIAPAIGMLWLRVCLESVLKIG